MGAQVEHRHVREWHVSGYRIVMPWKMGRGTSFTPSVTRKVSAQKDEWVREKDVDKVVWRSVTLFFMIMKTL